MWEMVKFLFSVKQKPDKLAEKEEDKRDFRGSRNEVVKNNGPRQWESQHTRKITTAVLGHS